MTKAECLDAVYNKARSVKYFEQTDESENGYANINGFVHLIKTKNSKTDVIISDNSKTAMQTESYKNGDIISRIHMIFASDPTAVYGNRQENILKIEKEPVTIRLGKIRNEKEPFFTLERTSRRQKIVCTVTSDRIKIQKYENKVLKDIETDTPVITIPIKDIETVLLKEHRQFAKSEPRLQQTLINMSRIIKRETGMISKIKNRLADIVTDIDIPEEV